MQRSNVKICCISLPSMTAALSLAELLCGALSLLTPQTKTSERMFNNVQNKAYYRYEKPLRV